MSIDFDREPLSNRAQPRQYTVASTYLDDDALEAQKGTISNAHPLPLLKGPELRLLIAIR